MSREIQAGDGAEQPKRRFGCLFYVISALLVFGIGLTVSYRVWYSSASSALRAEMDRIKARGEPLWFSELAPQPVDPADDATPLFMAAIEKFKKPPQSFYSLVWAVPPAPPTPPGKYAEFDSALAENRPALDLISRAVERPYLRLPIDYRTKQPLTISLEPVQRAREFSWLLAADVLQSIGAGDNDRAVAAVLDGLRLAELLRDEPFVLTQYVRAGIAGQAMESLETVVAHVELTPEQFAALDEQLGLMESRFRLAPSVHSERAVLLSAMSSLSGDAHEFYKWMADAGMTVPPGARVVISRSPVPLRMRDEAFMLRLMTEFADAIDMSGPEGRAANQQLSDQLRPGPDHVLSRLLMQTVLYARDAGLGHRQRLATARLGIRVQRFHVEHGKFPDSLDAVTDEKFPTVPFDLASGKPLVYRMLPDGFVIYPVGDNGVDDGGGVRPDSQEYATHFEVHLPSVAAAPKP